LRNDSAGTVSEVQRCAWMDAVRGSAPSIIGIRSACTVHFHPRLRPRCSDRAAIGNLSFASSLRFLNSFRYCVNVVAAAAAAAWDAVARPISVLRNKPRASARAANEGAGPLRQLNLASRPEKKQAAASRLGLIVRS
jgi:hypothetical protein